MPRLKEDFCIRFCRVKPVYVTKPSRDNKKRVGYKSQGV